MTDVAVPAGRRWAWITGGSSGIGLSLARLLLRDGWSVVLLARDATRLAQARTALGEAANADEHRVQTVSLDVSDEQAVADAGADLMQRLGTPRLVVLSAGVAEPGYFHGLAPAAHRWQMEINYFGSLWMARSVMEPMAAAGRGHLVLVSSAAGLVGVFGYSAYSPGKFAVRGLGEVLAAEYRRRNVHVSVVYPPDTDTPMLAAENRVKPVETRRIAAGGGLWSADEVARVILDGVRRRRFVIAPGLEISLLARLHSLVLPLLQWWMDRVAHREGSH